MSLSTLLPLLALLFGLSSTSEPGPSGPAQDAPPVGTGSRTEQPQPPAPDTSPLPEGVAATIDGEPITFAEYGLYLLELSGRRPLQDLIEQRLLEREALRLGVRVDPADAEAAALAEWSDYVSQRFQGNETKAAAELAREGLDKPMFLAGVRRRAWVEALVEAICIETRVVTEELVQERFEQAYGADGVRVEVSHIALNRGRMRAILAKRGVPPSELTQERLDAELDTLAAEVLARLAAGEDFAVVATETSHDLSARQTGGRIPGYNYLRHGPQFAVAVRAAEVGVVVGPVKTDVGLHVLLVHERVATTLDEVRDEVIALVVSDPASYEERAALERRLREEALIRTF